MTRAAEKGEQAGRCVWLSLACVLILVPAASGHLAWLLWRYIPFHAGIFAGMGMDLPLSTRVGIVASNWFVRLLPFVVLLLVPIAGLLGAAVLVAVVRRRPAWIIKGVAALGLVIILAEALASAFIVHSVQAGYSVAAADAKLQKYLQDFEAYRKQQPAAPFQP